MNPFDGLSIIVIIAFFSLIGIILFFRMRIKKICNTLANNIKSSRNENYNKTFVRLFGLVLFVLLFLYLLNSIYLFYILYSAITPNSVTLPQFISRILLASFLDGSGFCVLILSIFSVYLFLYLRGYDQNLRIHGINVVLFLYLAFILFISGSVMLSLPVANTTLNVNSTSITEITFNYSNSSDPLNFIQVSSYNFSNISGRYAENPSVNSNPQEEAIRYLSNGIFGNGIALIGLAIAVFGMAISIFDKIETSKNQEEILLRLQNKEHFLKKYKPVTPEQIITIGIIWGMCAAIIGLFIGAKIKNDTDLLFLSLPWIISNILIMIFGLLILSYGFYKTKEPVKEPEPITLAELLQIINDESRLKKG
jgi:hypothetical protein